jgi:hypothetical protein
MTTRRTWWVLSGLLAASLPLPRAQAAGATPAAPAPAPAPAAYPNPTAAPAPAAAPAAYASPIAAPAPATAAPAPAPGAPAADASASGVRLKALERSVNDLKEQVFRTRARLNLLKETVLGGVIGASRCVIRHKNEMGATFRLIKVVYALDGVQIMNKVDDTGRLADMPEFDVYNGAIQPGNHTLSVQVVYQGSGFGVFSYLKGYKFKASSSNTFLAADGKATQVTVVGYEKGGMTTNMEDKPAIEFKVNMLTPEGASAPAAKK